MARKQIKVTVTQIGRYLSKPEYLNFILTNKSVFLAKPVSLESDSVKVKNTKGHVLHLPLNQIEEIWAEEKVS